MVVRTTSGQFGQGGLNIRTGEIAPGVGNGHTRGILYFVGWVVVGIIHIIDSVIINRNRASIDIGYGRSTVTVIRDIRYFIGWIGIRIVYVQGDTIAIFNAQVTRGTIGTDRLVIRTTSGQFGQGGLYIGAGEIAPGIGNGHTSGILYFVGWVVIGIIYIIDPIIINRNGTSIDIGYRRCSVAVVGDNGYFIGRICIRVVNVQGNGVTIFDTDVTSRTIRSQGLVVRVRSLYIR